MLFVAVKDRCRHTWLASDGSVIVESSAGSGGPWWTASRQAYRLINPNLRLIVGCLQARIPLQKHVPDVLSLPEFTTYLGLR